MLFTPQKIKKIKGSSPREVFSLSTMILEETYDSTDNDQICESGILVIQARDPLSRLISYITRQEYSIIGTYEQYISSDSIIIDIFSVFNGENPNWTVNITTLSDLEKSNCVTKILMFPSIDRDKIEIVDHSKTSTRELLINLFGNNLTSLLGLKKLIPFLFSSEVPDIKDSTDPIKNLIEKSKRTSNQTRTILIDPIIKKSFKPDRLYLSKVVATFIDMLLSDSDFLDLVCGKYLNQVYSYDLLYELVLQHISIQDHTVNLIRDWVTKGQMDKQSLDLLIKSINECHQNTTTQLRESNNHEEIPEIPKELIVLDRTPSPIIINSVKSLHHQISRIVSAINRNEIPSIELNSIIRTVNNLSEYYGLDPDIKPIEKPSSGLLIVSPSEETSIPLTLKSGNQILLTTRNFDLGVFTREELIEILEVLDNITTDDRYDEIRAKITEEITKR